MAGQSVVQRERAAKASDITCLSSACTSDLFVSVIWPRHFATHSLRPQERNKLQLVRSTTICKKTNLSGGGQDSDDILCVIWKLELSDTYAGGTLVEHVSSTGRSCIVRRLNIIIPAETLIDRQRLLLVTTRYLPPLEMSILRPFKASDMFKFNNVYVGSLINSDISLTPSTVTWMSGQKQ